eukprot:6178780-Pleurochrysis_carterae.AAC.3
MSQSGRKEKKRDRAFRKLYELVPATLLLLFIAAVLTSLANAARSIVRRVAAAGWSDGWVRGGKSRMCRTTTTAVGRARGRSIPKYSLSSHNRKGEMQMLEETRGVIL